MSELQEMIAHCEIQGGLNLSDIARWLDMHLPTVREWANKGREPRNPRLQEVIRRMKVLKGLVDKLDPPNSLIPYSIKQPDRAHYIKVLKDEHIRVPKRRTSR